MEDDSLGAGISTPEHWSDVGPLSSRLQLVEQQVQVVQASGAETGCSPAPGLAKTGSFSGEIIEFIFVVHCWEVGCEPSYIDGFHSSCPAVVKPSICRVNRTHDFFWCLLACHACGTPKEEFLS